MAQIAIGAAISLAASYIFAPDGQDSEGPRLDDLKVQASTEGQFLKIVYGRMRVAGNIIQLPEGALTEEVKKDTEGETFFSSGTTITTYLYYANVLVGICEGPAWLNAIWANNSRLWADYSQNSALSLQLNDTLQGLGVL